MSDALQAAIGQRESNVADAWAAMRAMMRGKDRPGVNVAQCVALLGIPDGDLLDMAATARRHRELPDTAAALDAASIDLADAATDAARFDAATEDIVATLRATRANEQARREQAVQDRAAAVEQARRANDDRQQLETRHPYLFHDAFPAPTSPQNRKWYAVMAIRLNAGEAVELPPGIGLPFFARCVRTVAERVAADLV